MRSNIILASLFISIVAICGCRTGAVRCEPELFKQKHPGDSGAYKKIYQVDIEDEIIRVDLLYRAVGNVIGNIKAKAKDNEMRVFLDQLMVRYDRSREEDIDPLRKVRSVIEANPTATLYHFESEKDGVHEIGYLLLNKGDVIYKVVVISG
jgi:hypothetical protein